MRTTHTILVTEDEPEVRNYLETALKCQGYDVVLARDGEEMLSILQDSSITISAALLDIVMPRKDGLETLREVRSIDPHLPIIMVSGASTPLNVVEAMKNGATDFIAKPANHEDLRKALKNALERNSPRLPEPQEQPLTPAQKQVFFGSNSYMREIQGLLTQIGWSEAPVLIQGETGSGKEVLARALHACSPRHSKPFLKLNCAALPSELVESELFGYERGAFTGAFQKKPGMFEMADGGTIMLDEIGDMDFKLQAKLLQVLQDQEFQRLGGKETVKVDVRVIAATHRNLEEAMANETFREDLYYRLNVINLCVPPLRERKDDIFGLTEFLIRKHLPAGVPPPVVTASLRQAFLEYEWPGNIRELENVVRRLIILRDGELIARELRAKLARRHTTEAITQITPESSGNATILEQVTIAKQSAERTAIQAALDSTYWNRKKAAALLKIDYKALLYKMKKLGIDDKMVTMPSNNEVPVQ